VHPSGFSSRRIHGYIPAERIHVHIPGHTRWILGSYLHDIFQPRHSSFVAMMQLENCILQPCLTVPMYKIIRFISTLIDKKLPPDGSNGASWIFFRLPCFSIWLTNIIGCAPSAPDGSSPRGYSQKNSGIGSREYSNLLHAFLLVSFTDFAHFLNGFSSCVCCKPPESKMREAYSFWQDLAFPLIPFCFFSLFLFVPVFLMLSLLYAICTVKDPEIYFGPCHFRGPLARAYK
jgi:hypothetical protein